MAPDGITFHGYMDTPEAIQSFKDYQAWYQGDSPVTPAEPIPQIFSSKLAAFYVAPDIAISEINRLYPNGDFHYGVTGIPYYKDGSQLCHTGSWHFGVSPQTKTRESKNRPSMGRDADCRATRACRDRDVSRRALLARHEVGVGN